MTVKRMCELCEVTARNVEPATRDEVRELAREVLRLRTAVRSARTEASFIVAHCDDAVREDGLGGKENW